MSGRVDSLSNIAAATGRQTWPIATALRRSLRGYGAADLRADLMAGLVVGIVAIPLSMALAIAVGAPPQHGLYTAIVAGALCAALGGSKFQVTGPTAAFIVILAPIVQEFGLSGLLTAGMMAGIVLIAMGLARMGQLIQFIPYPVTTGFTAGIALTIATLQVKDLFGLTLGHHPEGFVERLFVYADAVGTVRPAELAIGLFSLTSVLILPRWLRRIPSPLVALALCAALAEGLRRAAPDLAVATIGTRFHTVVDGVEVAGIPALPPQLHLPWGEDGLTLAQIEALVPSAFAIAMLGAIESLLSAVIADGVTGKRHDPDAELVGQGIANVVAPFFGGIAATGALARTATNIRAGARSPVAAIVHAGVVLLALLAFAPLVAYIPMAALAGLLLVVAWNMSEVRHFGHILRVAPKSDVFVLLSCFVLTLLFDMVVSVGFGVVAASLLFMRRMAELTSSRILQPDTTERATSLPDGVVLYEVAGPLFFGAAQNAMGQLAAIDRKAKVVILSLAQVPAIDATGLVALESAVARLVAAERRVVIAGPLPEPRRVFAKLGLEQKIDGVSFAADTDAAITVAKEGLGESR